MDGDDLELQKLTIIVGRFRLSNPGRNIENLKSSIALTLQDLEMTSSSANLEIPSTMSSISVAGLFPWTSGDIIGPGMSMNIYMYVCMYIASRLQTEKEKTLQKPESA